MKQINFLFILLLPLLLCSQSTIKGIITEQNSSNKPIPAVQIKALGSEPELSDNAGQFQLNFKTKKPGDQIIITEISKKGYEIVNKDVINNWLVPNSNNYKTKIVMCPEGLIAQNTLKYYDISLTGLTKSYQERIRQLQLQRDKALIDSKTFNENSKVLSEQFENQQKQLETLADKFARENFDDCSLIHKLAFEKFKLGEISEAIRILETVNSENEIAKAKQQKEKGKILEKESKDMQIQSDNIIRQNISKLIFQAELYTSEFRFAEAEKTYETAVLADSNDFDNVFAFAKFYYNHVELENSIKWHKLALKIAQNDINKSEVLHYLGVLLINTDQIDSAEAKFNEAIQIRRKLAESNPKVFNIILANALSSISGIQFSKGKFQESEMSLMEALSIYQKLDTNDPDNKNERAFILSYLVDLMNKSDQFDKAKSYLTEAEKLYVELISINYKEKFNHFAWDPCYRLAVIQLKSGKLEQAEVNLEKSLELYRKLAKQNPLLYNYKIATVLDGLAVNQLSMKHFDEGELNALESVKMHREIIKTQPWDETNLAASLYTLAQIQCSKKQYDKAEANFNEVIIIYKEHDKINPQVYDFVIANYYFSFAVTNYEMDRYEEGEKYFKEALNINIELAKSSKEYKNTLAWRYGSYAAYQLKFKNFEIAEKMARKGLTTDSTVQWINTNLALALLFQGKFDEAKKIYIDFKDKDYPIDKKKKYKDAFLEDFDWLEKAGVTHPDVIMIKELLTK